MPFPTSSFALSGEYTAIQLIGQGGEGNVYRAVDSLGRLVAVKEAIPAEGKFDEKRFEARQKRFEQEVLLHANLKHANIVTVYDRKQDPRTREIYLFCEYVNGGSLDEHLEQHGPLAERQAIAIALDICAALEEVAGKGLVHRDIKPGNILLAKDDQGQITAAKLTDFGVARNLRRRPTTWFGENQPHPGTKEYRAPEQASLRTPVDVRTDLYALGASLWEMLTGPDCGPVLDGGPLVPQRVKPHPSRGSAMVIRRAIQQKPADRYQTPREMASDLQDVLSGRPLSAPPTVALHQPPQRRARRRLVPLAVALAALLLLGAGAWWLGPWAPRSVERESERPDESSVGRMIPRSAASDSMVHGQFGTLSVTPFPAQAGAVTYRGIYIPRDGRWFLRLRYSKYSPASAPIQVFLDDEPLARAVLHPVDQGSWDTFAWTEPVDLGTIAAGAHSLTFATDGQPYGVADLDRFVLTTGQ